MENVECQCKIMIQNCVYRMSLTLKQHAQERALPNISERLSDFLPLFFVLFTSS